MKILSRYLFKNLLAPLLYCIAAFSVIFIIADLFDNLSDFLQAGTPLPQLIKYYSWLLPSMVVLIVPVCLLLATLYSLAALTRHSEIVAMRASGISIYRIVRPYIGVGILCALFTAFINEKWAPESAYKADQFVDGQLQAEEDVYFEQIAFKNQSENRNWYVEKFDTRTYTMHNLEMIKHRDDGTDEFKVTASQARWMDGRWWFEDVVRQEYDNLGNLNGLPDKYETLEMRDIPEIPKDFMGEIKDPMYLSSFELWKYVQTHQHLSAETLTRYEVNYHHRLSSAFACLAIALMGIPAGAHTGRKGAFAGILMAVSLFFSFYVLQFVLEFLAKQMIIAPWVGPWSPIIVFLVIGSILVHRMR